MAGPLALQVAFSIGGGEGSGGCPPSPTVASKSLKYGDVGSEICGTAPDSATPMHALLTTATADADADGGVLDIFRFFLSLLVPGRRRSSCSSSVSA